MSMTIPETGGSGVGERVHLFQGDYVVTRDPHAMVTTILGSCVAACVRDPVAGLGGINHFLLPGRSSENPNDSSIKAGVHLMELLINGLLREGAQRQRLEAKIFGGARTMKKLADIGAANVEFATRFLEREGIAMLKGSTGGEHGRRIQFWPATGRIRQSLINPNLADNEPRRPISACVNQNAGELELF